MGSWIVNGTPAGIGVVMTCLFCLLYSLITPHKEFQLIRDGNISAALSMGGAIMGFSIPLSSAIIHRSASGICCYGVALPLWYRSLPFAP